MTLTLLVISIVAISSFIIGWQSGASRERAIARMDRFIGRL